MESHTFHVIKVFNAFCAVSPIHVITIIVVLIFSPSIKQQTTSFMDKYSIENSVFKYSTLFSFLKTGKGINYQDA